MFKWLADLFSGKPASTVVAEAKEEAKAVEQKISAEAKVIEGKIAAEAKVVEEKIKVVEVAAVNVAAKVSKKVVDALDKKGLLAKAKELGIKVNSRMTKDEIKDKLLKA